MTPGRNEACRRIAWVAVGVLASAAQCHAVLRRGDRLSAVAPARFADSPAGLAEASLIRWQKPPKINVETKKLPPIGQSKDGNVTENTPSRLVCGQTEKVSSSTDKRERCPAECPYYVQNRNDEDFCTFTCVAAEDCAKYHPKTQIGDDEFGVCRACIVDGCKTCDNTVLTDRCAECDAGYVMKADGTCHLWYMGTWVYVVLGLLGVLVLLIVLWIVDMGIRPVWNPKGLEEGHDQRDRMKLRDYSTSEAKLFPLGTNLHKTCVAGPGMLLHFNFQLAVIIWAVFVALVWMYFAHFVDKDLWRLGTRRYGTPRDNCILVAWGYETQHRLMWTKVAFLWIVYIGTCVGLIFFAIYQFRRHQQLDIDQKTIKDFAVMVVGLPELAGEGTVEEELKATMASWSGEGVVGVSVAWQYKDQSEDVDELMLMNLKQRLAECDRQPRDVDPTPPEMNAVRKWLWTQEQKLLGLVTEEDEAKKWDAPAIKEFLSGLKSSDRAIVVFETEEAKQRALNKSAESGGFDIQGSHVELEDVNVEPDTVQWANLASSDTGRVVIKVILGFGIIALACFFWAVVFYAPYAYYVLTFNYSNGRQPGFIVGFSFSMIVVIGNAIMYETCARISDWVGLSYRDQREVCYMMLYTIACMFNVLLDFVTTYITAGIVLESLGFRTYFGVKIRDLDSFTLRFESYGMQRALAENTFAYAFPSTFLIPFLIEGLPTMAVPYWMGRLIVKSHPEVRGLDAEGWLEMLPMDIGRYADILLNIILGILIFYFPGGYTWTLFLGMAASHVWIYLFDYYKVLRQIPAVSYVEIDCDWWCQVLLAPIVSIIPACIMFKTNCEPGCHCYKGPTLIAACTLAAVVHTIFHVCFLKFVLPFCAVRSRDNAKLEGITYKDCATFLPATWFNTNPVHCLRSKYVYEHNPPCDFYRCGREEFMRANPAIGCFLSHEIDTLVSVRSSCMGNSPHP